MSTKIGRPSKLTIEVQEKICTAIQLGGYIETAAAFGGVDKDTLYDWLKRGQREIDRRRRLGEEVERENSFDQNQRQRKHRPEELERRRKREETDKVTRGAEQAYVAFSDSIKKALADAELGYLSVIHKAAKGGSVVSRITTQNDDGTSTTSEKFSRSEWTAAAWCLERRSPEKWGRRQVEVVGSDGSPLEIKISWADAIRETLKLKEERREKDVTILSDPKDLKLLPNESNE